MSEENKEKPVNHTAFGLLVDCEQWQFEAVLQKFNVGEMRSLLVLFRTTYSQMVTMKDAILKVSMDETDPQKREEAKKTLAGMYSEMQKIEDRCTLLVQLIKKRVIPIPNKYNMHLFENNSEESKQ